MEEPALLQKNINIDSGVNFDNDRLQSIRIYYTCYQNCFGSSTLYGCAVFGAAELGVMNFVSSVNCPGKDGQKIEGAQFDLQLLDCRISNINSTGSNSEFTGGVEFRKVETGIFQFLSVSDMKCMFSTSFTRIEILGILLSRSNFYNITLKRSSIINDGNAFSGIIYVNYAT